MPRSIWKGSISFGLVHIPVGLFPAEKRDELSFHMLDRRDMAPIGYQRINKETGETVEWADIVKGYEHEPGRWVVLSDDDFKAANAEATQTVEILDFVDADAIDPVYFDKPYFLGPLNKKSAKPYALLRDVLASMHKVGIARVVLRNRQSMAAVMPHGRAIVVNLLRYAHELRKPDDLDLPDEDAGVGEREMELAARLVEGMSGPWAPEKYRDEYREDLLRLIEQRVNAGEDAAAPQAEAAPAREGKVVDLMSLLKRSVEAQAKAAPAPKTARTKKATATPKKGQAKASPEAAEAQRETQRKSRKKSA
jgi:DNA end-binding protein Ku